MNSQKITKKLLKLSLITTVSISLAALTAIVCFIHYLESNHALKKLESILNRHIPGEIHCQKISINVWKPGIDLHHVLIQSKNQIPITGCERLRLELSLSQLLSAPIKIKRFSLFRPWLFLPVSQSQPLNFKRLAPFFSLIDQLTQQRLLPAYHTENSSSLVVDALEIIDGTIYFSQDSHQEAFCFEQINITAHKDQLDLKGNLSYAVSPSSHLQMLQLKTTGIYSQETMAQTLIDLMSSNTPDIFYERVEKIQKQLRFQTQGQINLVDALFKHMDAISKEITGNIQGYFDLNALSKHPKIDLSLDYSGGNIHDIHVKNISVRANASDQMITVNRMNLQTQSGDIDIQGLIDLRRLLSDGLFPKKENWDQLSYQFIIDAQKISLKPFFQGIASESLISARINLKGHGIDVDSLSSDITIDATTTLPPKFHIQPETPLNMQATVHIESDSLTIVSLSAKTEGFSLTGQGNMTLFSEPDGQLSVNMTSSGKWLKVFKLPVLTGEIHTSLTIDKHPAETKASIHLVANELSLKDYLLGNFVADASMSSKGRITIDRAIVSQSSSHIETNGFVEWKDLSSCMTHPPEKYSLSIHSNDIQINTIHPALSGTLTVNGQAKGSGRSPEGDLYINGTSLNLFGQKILSARIPVHLSEQKLCLDSGEVEFSAKERIVIQGCIDKGQNFHLNVDSEPLAFSHIKGCIPELSGNIRLKIDGNGHLKHPQLKGEIVASSIFFKGQPLPESIFHISSEKDYLTINGKSILEFYGKYHMSKHDFKISAQAHKMKLSPILTCAGFSKIDGVLSGEFQMNGDLNNIRNTNTHLRIDQAIVIFHDRPVAWMNDISISIDHRKLTSSNYTIHFPNGGFCKGSATGLFPDGTTININSKIPLKAFSAVIDNIGDIQGDMFVKGSLSNIFNDPTFEGQVRIADGNYVLPWNNQRFHHIQGILDASHHLFALKQFSFGVDEGKCDIQGKVILSNRKPTHINLNVSASALPVHIPDCADILLNANLNFEQNYRQSRLNGSLEFLETLYYQELNVNQLLLERIQQTRRPKLFDTACRTFPGICNTKLDVSIQSRQPLVADNDLAYLEIHPDLNIRGTLFNPVVLGRAEIVTGEINYLSKNFILEKGLIDFINPYRTEPVLDIESNVDIRDWQISLDVLGKLNELQVKLRSTPSEEHADIISILLFGKPADRLFAPSSGPYKSNQQMIAELLSSAFEKDIKQTTGLDTFKLEALEHETIEENQTDDYRVTLGKELSRRMSVTYAFETRNGQLIHHTVADYKILENLMLRGMQDTLGTYGGELLFRMEFRQMPGGDWRHIFTYQ
ncbi:MAG: translocation/assembly module TamB domain-containing protein [Candidatus Magnetomorum sp.]|nr:translocation/assembly module TamB domain-containing protein [Candidatus Magnetomorum sp.]